MGNEFSKQELRNLVSDAWDIFADGYVSGGDELVVKNSKARIWGRKAQGIKNFRKNLPKG